ncbi:MAG TPA: hypothetical protein PL024_04810 [Thauera sp.]|nr:hypothetical protein [Thauera sp.]
MPSSISSSDSHLPAVPWLQILSAAALLSFAVATAFEVRLADLGYRPTARDSAARWLAERARASRLGEQALILIGASRIQLGLDMDALREGTGLEPVMLALDGSGSDPVLEGLSRDPTIRGTILVDYYDHAVGVFGDAAEKRQRLYEASAIHAGFWQKPAEYSEELLTRMLRERLRIYADGATPIQSVQRRLLSSATSTQYLVTRPDRSRVADYSLAQIPSAYYRRAARMLGGEAEQLNVRAPGIEETLSRQVASIAPVDNTGFLASARALADMSARIRSRGGNVVFIAMPSSGMVREIETRRRPYALFWEPFMRLPGIAGVHSAYEPELKGFTCPDGSHLDMRDRVAYTHALIGVLKRKGLWKD